VRAISPWRGATARGRNLDRSSSAIPPPPRASPSRIAGFGGADIVLLAYGVLGDAEAGGDRPRPCPICDRYGISPSAAAWCLASAALLDASAAARWW